MPAIPVVGHSLPAVRLSERARLDEPRGILGFLLLLFLLVHVAMIILSGFKRQMRAMTIGK